MKKLICLVIGALIAMQAAAFSVCAESEYDDMFENARAFASQYPYKEEDDDKTFAESMAQLYTSGIETREDGVEYECPALYIDEHAGFFGDFDLKMGEMSLLINGTPSVYGQKCVLHNDTTLVPVAVFDELGCEITYDETYDLTTLKKDDTVLEIIPHLIGMRKNRAEGYYVPLGGCARYVEGDLYVPLRVVAEQLGLQVGWIGETHSVTIDG